MKDKKRKVAKGDWEREKEILRKIITGQIDLLVIGEEREN